jgi:hypothetical protein
VLPLKASDDCVMRIRLYSCWTVAILVFAASLCRAQVVTSDSDEAKSGSGLSLRRKAEAGESAAQYQVGLEAEQR